MADIFISHSSKDRDIAEELYKRLGMNGISCWISSHNLVGGDRWAQNINDEITNHAFLL